MRWKLHNKSRIWACFLKYLLEFSISLTKKSITQLMLIDKFKFQTDFLFYKYTDSSREENSD